MVGLVVLCKRDERSCGVLGFLPFLFEELYLTQVVTSTQGNSKGLNVSSADKDVRDWVYFNVLSIVFHLERNNVKDDKPEKKQLCHLACCISLETTSPTITPQSIKHVFHFRGCSFTSELDPSQGLVETLRSADTYGG
jgi:hypothetical protein